VTQTRSKLSDEQRARLTRLTESGPQTLGGKLLRKSWQPAALSGDVPVGRAKAVRLLGEDLTLYRGHSGKVHLVAGECAHRRTRLHTGWIEGDEIRCMYHGWKFDAEGRCTERPAEKRSHDSGIRIASYPVHEYCGVVFAYMGEEAAPPFELPRKAAFEAPGMLLFQRKEIWPCNWLQNVENQLDAVHVSFPHQMGKVGAFGEAITGEVPEVTFRETEAGICQTAVRRGANGQVRVSDWTFPNANHVIIPGVTRDDPWTEVSHWMVPIDDERTLRVAILAMPSTSEEADEKLARYYAETQDFNSADYHDELFRGKYPSDPLIRLTSAQDYVALIGQGAIADRENECLGVSDVGIAMLRRIIWREQDAISAARPTKAWRPLERPSELFTTGS